MKKDWKQERAKAVKYARLNKKKPALREALYGREGSPPDAKAGSRETAQKDNDNG
jgi:hypothetical protein